MNEMAAVQGAAMAARPLVEIEAEIMAHKRTIGRSVVLIGQALMEAKEQLEHGAWGEWLQTRVNFSQSTAENYMRVAAQIGSESTLLNLPYTKILALMAVPEGEREEFARENQVEDKSVSQIKQLIRERDEAKAYAETQRAQYIRETQRADSLAKEKREADARIRELEARKPETVTVEKEVVPEDYELIKTMLHSTREMLAETSDELTQANAERDAALEELEMEKMTAGDAADPLDVTPFCDACSALLNRLYAAPFAGDFLRTKTDVELERYAMNVSLIMEWSVKVQDVIENIKSERSGLEYDFSIA